MRKTAALLLATAVLALAACASPSASTFSPAPAPPTSFASSLFTGSAATPAATCADQVQSWLGDTSLFPNGATLQQGITQVYQDAQQYLTMFAGNPSGAAATTILSIYGDQNGADMTTLADAPPSCADPAGYFADAGTQWGNATSTDTGTPQAAGDMRAVLSDFSSLLAELARTAPGSGFTLPAK